MKNILITLTAILSFSAHADYKVTLTMDDQNNTPVSVSRVATVNSKTDFSSVNEVQYVSAVETTTTWYHRLFGIKPTPNEVIGKTNVGLAGNFTIQQYSQSDTLFVKINSTYVELLDVATFEIDNTTVQAPRLSELNLNQQITVDLVDDEGCIESFAVVNDIEFSLCVQNL